MKKNQIIGLGAALVIIVVAVAAIAMQGSKSSTTMSMSSTASSSSSSNSIEIQNYMFSPMVTKVKVGATVTWTNKDSVNHTVNADNASADAPSSMDIAQGKSYSFTFKKAGTYTYHCFPHPYMHGTVQVTE